MAAPAPAPCCDLVGGPESHHAGSDKLRCMAPPGPYLDLVGGLKTIQLVQQLQHGPLDLRVSTATAATAVTPGTADAVHLIHEDDAGGMLPAYQHNLFIYLCVHILSISVYIDTTSYHVAYHDT